MHALETVLTDDIGEDLKHSVFNTLLAAQQSNERTVGQEELLKYAFRYFKKSSSTSTKELQEKFEPYFISDIAPLKALKPKIDEAERIEKVLDKRQRLYTIGYAAGLCVIAFEPSSTTAPIAVLAGIAAFCLYQPAEKRREEAVKKAEKTVKPIIEKQVQEKYRSISQETFEKIFRETYQEVSDLLQRKSSW